MEISAEFDDGPQIDVSWGGDGARVEMITFLVAPPPSPPTPPTLFKSPSGTLFPVYPYIRSEYTGRPFRTLFLDILKPSTCWHFLYTRYGYTLGSSTPFSGISLSYSPTVWVRSRRPVVISGVSLYQTWIHSGPFSTLFCCILQLSTCTSLSSISIHQDWIFSFCLL
jgi:hypothetical protein